MTTSRVGEAWRPAAGNTRNEPTGTPPAAGCTRRSRCEGTLNDDGSMPVAGVVESRHWGRGRSGTTPMSRAILILE